MTAETESKVINELNENGVKYETDDFGNIFVSRSERRNMNELGWSYDHKKKSWEKIYPLATKGDKELAKLFA